MSLLATRIALTHRCRIERAMNASTAADGWDNAATPVWQDHLAGLPCRLGIATGREAFDTTTSVVVEDGRLLVTTDTDVTEADRVAEVTYREETILAGPVSIRAVLRHRDHLELILVRLH